MFPDVVRGASFVYSHCFHTHASSFSVYQHVATSALVYHPCVIFFLYIHQDRFVVRSPLLGSSCSTYLTGDSSEVDY